MPEILRSTTLEEFIVATEKVMREQKREEEEEAMQRGAAMMLQFVIMIVLHFGLNTQEKSCDALVISVHLDLRGPRQGGGVRCDRAGRQDQEDLQPGSLQQHTQQGDGGSDGSSVLSPAATAAKRESAIGRTMP